MKITLTARLVVGKLFMVDTDKETRGMILSAAYIESPLCRHVRSLISHPQQVFPGEYPDR
jgi:hypothetical protein